MNFRCVANVFVYKSGCDVKEFRTRPLSEFFLAYYESTFHCLKYFGVCYKSAFHKPGIDKENCCNFSNEGHPLDGSYVTCEFIEI